jgi:hypothetical protein
MVTRPGAIVLAVALFGCARTEPIELPNACPSGSAHTPATSRAAHTTGARIALGGAAGTQQGAQNKVKSCNLKDKSKIHSAGRDQ